MNLDVWFVGNLFLVKMKRYFGRVNEIKIRKINENDFDVWFVGKLFLVKMNEILKRGRNIRKIPRNRFWCMIQGMWHVWLLLYYWSDICNFKVIPLHEILDYCDVLRQRSQNLCLPHMSLQSNSFACDPQLLQRRQRRKRIRNLLLRSFVTSKAISLHDILHICNIGNVSGTFFLSTYITLKHFGCMQYPTFVM